MADLHSKVLDARPSQIFFHFHAVFEKNGQIIGWRPTLGNPGSTADIGKFQLFHYVYSRQRIPGSARLPRGPNYFIFMQLSAKKLQNNRLAHQFWELVPPQENPGSAIEFLIRKQTNIFCNTTYHNTTNSLQFYAIVIIHKKFEFSKNLTVAVVSIFKSIHY